MFSSTITYDGVTTSASDTLDTSMIRVTEPTMGGYTLLQLTELRYAMQKHNLSIDELIAVLVEL